jgi:hypothetical protein
MPSQVADTQATPAPQPLWGSSAGWRPAGVSALGVALVAWVASATLGASHPYAQGALWAGLMAVSFVGWGRLVNLWLSPAVLADWGLRAGWGMTLSVLVGGFLSFLHLVSRPLLVAQVALGVALFLWPLSPRALMRRLRDPSMPSRVVKKVGVGALAFVVALWVGCSALGHLGDASFNPSDDAPLYLTLAEKLCHAGSLFEPFAARRASILGGHVYLHAMFLAGAQVWYIHVVDGGVCLVIAVAILFGYAQERRTRSGLVAAGLSLVVLVTLRSVERNTGSLYSGIVALLTLYRTLRVPCALPREMQEKTAPAEASRWLGARARWPVEARRTVALAGLSLFSILLRPSNAPTVLAFLVFVLVSDYLSLCPAPWSRSALGSLGRVTVLFAGTFVLLLSPWSIMLEQSSGTFFFPLGKSNMTPGFSYVSAANTLADAATRLVNYFSYGKPLGALALFVIVGLLPLSRRNRNDLVALSLAVLVGLLALARSATQFDVDDTSRWFFSYVATFGLLVAASARDGMPAGLLAVPVVAHAVLGLGEMGDLLKTRIGQSGDAYTRDHAMLDTWNRMSADYSDVQSHIPAGATVATAVFENCRFDFQRNTIYELDVLGGMGPAPGWPVGKGAEALAQYLRGVGVRYVVWVDFNLPSEFYNRAHWKGHLQKVGFYLSAWAPIQLDAEDALDAFPKIRNVVYRGHGMTVVDLDAPPSSTAGK